MTLRWSHSLGFYRSGCRGLQVLGLGWWHKALLKRQKDDVVVRVMALLICNLRRGYSPTFGPRIENLLSLL